MNRLRRLDVRLFLSYALIVIVGAAALAITFAVVAPNTFDNRMMGMGSGTARAHSAFSDVLRTALPIAILVSVTLSAFVAAFVARRILAPIDAVRRATARLADGHYDERLEEPDELELADLAADVNRLAAALESTEHRRRELISEVAHEMRTPLTTIDGYLEGILDGVFEPTEEVFTSIAEESARLGRLATDLASLSVTDERALELHLERVELGEVVAAVVERLRPQFDAKNVGLELAAPGAPAFVEIDRQRIVQVLTNLIGNALTYTEAGGQVTVTTTAGPAVASVVVVDTGIGLTPDGLRRVFERFYRAPGVSRPPGGSGIGLTIALALARVHGGDIHASSPGVGGGSTFTLTLPTARPLPRSPR